MVTALAAAGVALLLWPGHCPARRLRLRPAGRRRRDRPHRVLRQPALPVPVAAGIALVAAVISTPLVAVLAGGLAGLTAHAWRRGRRSGDADAQLGALAQGLGSLAADLRSGRSLVAATRAAADGCGHPTAGAALLRAVQVPDLPSDAPPALREPLDRVTAAVLLSARTGCSLADVLTAVEDDLRARRRAALELRSATAGPRAGALLLAGLPALGLAMGSGVGADPWRVLTTTPTGQVLLVAGVCLEVAGVAWSGRLVRRALR